MHWHYFVHLVGWAVPLLALQWLAGWRVFRRNMRVIFAPALLATLFYALTATVEQAVYADQPRRFTGLVSIKDYPGHTIPGMLDELLRLPVEMLVTQSFVLLLPKAHRRD